MQRATLVGTVGVAVRWWWTHWQRFMNPDHD
jgi:hypothetical protein